MTAKGNVTPQMRTSRVRQVLPEVCGRGVCGGPKRGRRGTATKVTKLWDCPVEELVRVATEGP